MQIRISTPSSTFETSDLSKIENTIRSCPELWISGMDDYPCISVLTNGEYACVNYFGKQESDLWLSKSGSTQSVRFYPGGAEWDSPADAVISIETAIECVGEFCRCLTRPTNIEWQYGV